MSLKRLGRSGRDVRNKSRATDNLQFQALKDICSALERALSLGKRRDDCNESLRQCPDLQTPDWNDEAQIDQLIASCRGALKQLAEREILKVEEPIGSLAGRTDAHFVVSDLLQAIRNRDIEEYKQVKNEIQSLKDECLRMQKLDADIENLRQFVPNLHLRNWSKATMSLAGTSAFNR